MEGHHEGQVGVPTEAISDALADLYAVEAAVRRAAGAVVGGSNGTFWDEARGLEGVVSKRRNAPYRSRECWDWRKIKTDAWREANRERWSLFE